MKKRTDTLCLLLEQYCDAAERHPALAGQQPLGIHQHAPLPTRLVVLQWYILFASSLLYPLLPFFTFLFE